LKQTDYPWKPPFHPEGLSHARCVKVFNKCYEIPTDVDTKHLQ